MRRRPQITTSTDTLFPYTSRFRSASGNGCVIDAQTARLHRAERAILTQRDLGQIVIRTNTAYDDIRLLRRLRRTDGCFAAMFLHPCPGLRHRAIENRDVVPRPDKMPRHGCAHYSKADICDFCHQDGRSEEHTSELTSLIRISYAVFCLKQ